MKLCPLCGNKVDQLKGGLCSSCSREKNEIKIKNSVITKCEKCEKYLFKNKWTKKHNLKDAVKDIIISKIDTNGNFRLIIPEHTENAGVKSEAQIELQVDDNDYLIPFFIEYTLCEKCGKEGTKYFEGVLQLRNLTQELLTFVENDIKKNADKGVFVTKMEELKNGIDLYITSKSYLRSIGKKLNRQFNGELKSSAKLFTKNKQTSKAVYRTNVLFRLKTA